MTTQSDTRGATSLYERYAGNPAENYQRYFVPDIGEPFARETVAAAQLGEGDRVLDVASGTGVAARIAAEHVGADGAVTGIDMNPAMLAVARTTAGPGAPVEWNESPAESLPFDDQSFDAVVGSLGFQFFTDKPAALREMHRVLNPGGGISLSTTGPIPPSLQAIDAVLADHLGPQASAFIAAVFSVYDADEMRKMLTEAGFADIGIDHHPIPLRVAPPADFVWQYVNSTPLAALAADLDEDGRVAMERAIVERCEPFTDRGSLVMEPKVLIATARRSTE